MMFLAKKIVSLLLSPMFLGLALLLAGLYCLWATKKQRLGKVIVTLGTIFLLLLSLPLFPKKLLAPLDAHYPALLHPETIVWPGDTGANSPKWIVVLGGGHNSDPRLPAAGQLSRQALARLVEGVRLHKAIPGSKLLLSGGGVYDPVPEADVMAQVAVLLGVNPQNITLERDSRDTEDEAALIAKLVGAQKIILVTSAAHMLRSVALFKKYGFQPIPAPTDFRIIAARGPDPARFFPSGGAVMTAEIAWHEYLGLAWAWLRGAR